MMRSLATFACKRASSLRATPQLLSSSARTMASSSSDSSKGGQQEKGAHAPPASTAAPGVTAAPPEPPPRSVPPRHLSSTPPSPASEPRAAVARHGKQRDDQKERQHHPPQEEVELPPNPAAASAAGPYASRPDRDPWPAPMPCLSREAGAGFGDESYNTMSGSVAGTHTPGAHHLEADGTDVDDDDRVSPPADEPLEMPREESRYAYPLDRDPSVGGGMATRSRPRGTQLPPDT